MAAVVEKLLLGSQTTLITGANLQALANNTNINGTVFDNTIGQTGDGYTLCDVELYLDGFGSAVTSNTGFTMWFLMSSDGTNYEDGGAGVLPARLPDVVFPLRAVSTAQRVVRRVLLPWGKFTPMIRNEGTGQTVNNNTNSYCKVRPVTRELV